MIKVTIAYSGNSITKSFPEGTTVSTVVQDRNLQAALGFGSNVEAQQDGVVLSQNTQLADGDTIDLVTKSNSKA